jgi:hypothetical protein
MCLCVYVCAYTEFLRIKREPKFFRKLEIDIIIISYTMNLYSKKMVPNVIINLLFRTNQHGQFFFFLKFQWFMEEQFRNSNLGVET